MTKDYKNGKIYKIEVDGEIYVGSTTLPYLCKRMYYHKNNSKQERNQGIKLYQKIREREDCWVNIEIILLETFPCNSSDELRSRERYWKDELKATLNMRCPYRTTREETQREYRERNKVAIANINKVYSEKNKETIANRKKEWYESNKGRWKEYREKNKDNIYSKVSCPHCDKEITYSNMTRHIKRIHNKA